MTERPTVTIIRRPLQQSGRAMLNGADLKLTALLPLLFGVSWLAPTTAWEPFCRRLAGRAGGDNSITRGVRLSGLGPDLAVPARDIAQSLGTHRFLSYLQYLRDHRPAGWRCHAEMDGAEALHQASTDGRGVILWVGHFVYNGLPLKKALWQAGFRTYHLSRPEHGFSDTRYGVAVLNPLRSRIEERYLERRIIIKRGAEHVALREAHRLLGQGKMISITAGHWEGRQVARVPVGDALLPVSTGAPSLAHATGAPLFPVFITREQDASFRIRIGTALGCDRQLPREVAVQSALAGFSQQLMAAIRAAPGQWRGWKYLAPVS